MSQELHRLLQERARVGLMSWPKGVIISVCMHLGFALAILFVNAKDKQKAESVKVTWVTLPAATGGPAGGSTAQEAGKEGERVRRVEEVAPKAAEKKAAPPTPTPNAFSQKKTAPAKGTSTKTSSIGKAPMASKSAKPDPHSTSGAAGRGEGGGIGEGSNSPALKSANGVVGGTGQIDLEGDFPFVWYLQQVQGAITGNWNRLGGQGRVQIYFRIKRDGKIEGTRVESPSGNASLDQSAILAVRRSDPLPRLPEGYDGGSLIVRFWFSSVGN